MKKFFKDFKAFISRGNILDMAIGVIIGGAFSAIVTAFTNKIIMPIVNWVLMLIGGGNGLSSAYTFLKIVPQVDEAGDFIPGTIDLANSIYIDWGAFITAILDFLIIALTLFIILKVAMNASGYIRKTVGENPTREERKALKAQGVDLKDHKAVVAATAELREKNKPAPVAPKPTQEELLTGILEELKKQNEKPEVVTNPEPAAEETAPKKAKTTKQPKAETKTQKKPTAKAQPKERK